MLRERYQQLVQRLAQSDLKQLRKGFIDAVGVRATHALQDGATLGVIFGLSLTFPAAVTVIAGILGLEGVRPKKILASADEVVRVEDIRPNPEYFVGGFLGGGLGGGLAGVAFDTLAASQGISLDVVEILVQLL